MANADRPRGFAPYGKLVRASEYEAGSACYPGDIVALASDGQVDPVSTGDNKALGVCLSYAAAAGDKILVADHPDQLFVGQADETELDAQTDIGQTCDITATGGNSTYKTSRMEVDSSTVGSSKQLIILGIERRPDNALGAQADVIVRINKHQLEASFAGV
jgi:hypothetical protein